MKILQSLCLIILLAACSKQTTVSDIAIRNTKIPIFIEIPNNPLAFDNISPIAYEAIHHHYLRIGYTMVNNIGDGYVLRTKVRGIDPVNKLVSPDIVLMHTTIKVELECTLLNFKKDIVACKTFLFSTLISKSRNPIMNSDFIDFEYKKLLERSVPKIERFFRPFLLDAFKDNIN